MSKSSKLSAVEEVSNASVEEDDETSLLFPLKRSGQMLEKRLPITSEFFSELELSFSEFQLPESGGFKEEVLEFD